MTNPRTPGRPREYAERMPRVTVRLNPETVAIARDLGNGNLSKGLRIACSLAQGIKLRQKPDWNKGG